MKGLLPSGAWAEVRIIKKMKSGVATDGDTIDLRALTGGIAWGLTTVLTSPNAIAISGNTRSFLSDTTPLGNDKYKINVNTTSSTVGSLSTQYTWSFIVRDRAQDQTNTKYVTVTSCRIVNISGGFTEYPREGFGVDHNATVRIEIKETVINTGAVTDWTTVFYKSYNSSGSVDFNRLYETDTKVEIKTTLYSGSLDMYYPVMKTVNIYYKKSSEVVSEVTGGTATWIASEV